MEAICCSQKRCFISDEWYHFIWYGILSHHVVKQIHQSYEIPSHGLQWVIQWLMGQNSIQNTLTHSISKMRCFFLWQQAVNILIEYRGNFCETLMIVCLYYSSDSHHWCTKLWNFSKCVFQSCWPQHFCIKLRLPDMHANIIIVSNRSIIVRFVSTISIFGHVSSLEVWMI